MVAHEHIGVNTDVVMLSGMIQQVQIMSSIVRVQKYCATIYAALDDVKRDLRENESGTTWH